MNINESTSLVNSLTPSAPDQTSRSQSTTGSSDGHSINDTASQNSFLANIGNAVTGWWTGNQAPTENQHEEITAARLTIPPNYRPTIIRETFAQRQIARQAAREAARQDQQSSSSSPDNGTAAVSEQSSVQKQQSAASQQRAEAALRRLKEQQSAAAAVTAASSSPDNGTAAVSEPSSVLKQPSVASQQRAEAVLRRLKEQQSAAAAVASSQTSPSSSAEKPHLEEMRLEHNSNNLSQPLLTRMGEISNRLDSLVTEIAAQSKVIQRAQQKLEEADEKLAQLTIEQLDSSERQRQQAQHTFTGQRREQDYEYQQSLAEELGAEVDRETAKLASLEQQHPLLEQQQALLGRVQSSMNEAQNRLPGLEESYNKLGASTDKRITRGNKFLGDARVLLQDIVTTTLSIVAEEDPIRALARIDQEDSSTQLQKATRSLDQAQAALIAINRAKSSSLV